MRASILISQIQRLLGDPDGDFHTTEKVLDYLNTAIEDICTRSRTLCSWTFLRATAGRGMYGMPDDFLEFKYVGFYYQDQLLPLHPEGLADAAPAIFSERLAHPRSIPHTYADGGNAYIEKLVGTIREVETTAATTDIQYTSIDVPEDPTDAELGDFVLAEVATLGGYAGEADTINDILPPQTSGAIFVVGSQLLAQINQDGSLIAYIRGEFQNTANGNLTGELIGNNQENNLKAYFTDSEGADTYDATKAYYYYDTSKEKLQLIRRTERTLEGYENNPETDFAVQLTRAQFASINTGDRLINYTDNAEGFITEKAWYSDEIAIIYFENVQFGTDNLMSVGDEFRITTPTQHVHTLAISPPPRKDDTTGAESIYIFYARTHPTITLAHLENATDEIEIGAEFHTALRHRICYYGSQEEFGIDGTRTQLYDVKYETDYMKAFPKANRRIRQVISSWRQNTRRPRPRVTITQVADYTVRNPAVE